MSPCRLAPGTASKAHCRIAESMLVERNVDGADDVVQSGLSEDPEHTELNALQVSMNLLDLQFESQLTVCTQN